MRHAPVWQLALAALNSGRPVALVTVAAIKGSAPREPGACMCVTNGEIAGTIGGGTLEFRAIESARELLQEQTEWLHQQLGLGPALGQCCGGRVELLIEQLNQQDMRWLKQCLENRQDQLLVSRYDPTGRHKQLQVSTGYPHTVHFSSPMEGHCRLEQASQPGQFHLLLFGAGHLGRALVPLLSTLPCSVHWIDSREDTLPTESKPKLRTEWLETPTLALQSAPLGSMVLVMTHQHSLDFEITSAALANPHISWVGMIGSPSKRKQFERYLKRCPNSPASTRLACPIGNRNSELRDPAELAIELSAALLHARTNCQTLPVENQHHA